MKVEIDDNRRRTIENGKTCISKFTFFTKYYTKRKNNIINKILANKSKERKNDD